MKRRNASFDFFKFLIDNGGIIVAHVAAKSQHGATGAHETRRNAQRIEAGSQRNHFVGQGTRKGGKWRAGPKPKTGTDRWQRQLFTGFPMNTHLPFFKKPKSKLIIKLNCCFIRIYGALDLYELVDSITGLN
jgi:hypothetical protein